MDELREIVEKLSACIIKVFHKDDVLQRMYLVRHIIDLEKLDGFHLSQRIENETDMLEPLQSKSRYLDVSKKIQNSG